MTKSPNYAELEQRTKELEQTVLRFEDVKTALQESEKHYQDIVNNAVVGFYQATAEGKFVQVNPKFAQMFGYESPAEFLSSVSSIFELYVCPEDRPPILHEMNTKGFVDDAETRFWRKDGQIIWVRIRARAIHQHPKETIYEGFMVDITERKQFEQSLREKEMRYRLLYNRTPVMLHSIDSSGKLLSASDLWLDVMGYERDEVIGHKSTEFLTPTSRQYANEVILPLFFETGYIKDIPYQMVTKKGDTIDVLMSATAEKDEKGNINRSLAVMIDITERKRAEAELAKYREHLEESVRARTAELEAANRELEQEIAQRKIAEAALQESERRYRVSIESAPYGIMVHYADGDILIYNSQLEKITGYSKQEIPDIRTWLEKLYPDKTHRKKVIEDRKESILEGRLRVREGTITRKCGQKPICQFSTILLTSGIQIVFVNDVTDQKRAEADLKSAKDELEHRIRERTKELEIQTHHLAEMNTTLRVLLTERSKDKEELEERVLYNVKELVLPYIEKLDQSHLDHRQKSLVDILSSNLSDITSTFSRSLPIKYLNLTPSEIQIVNLLKQGKTTKEIAELLNLSGRTIETHRKNIRKKLGLNNSKANLRSHLLAIH